MVNSKCSLHFSLILLSVISLANASDINGITKNSVKEHSNLQNELSSLFTLPTSVEDLETFSPFLNELEATANIVPKKSIFALMNMNHKKAMRTIMKIFEAQISAEELLQTARILRNYPEMNYKLWLTSFMAVALRNKELKDLQWPHILHLMPDAFINSHALGLAKEQILSGVSKDQETCIAVDGTIGIDNGVENDLWYFREDILTNVQHYYWHMTNMFPVAPNETTGLGDRHGELFYYFHNHMLTRYQAERLSNDFNRIEPLNLTEGEIIEEGYNGHMTDWNAFLDWSARGPNITLTNTTYWEEITSVINSDMDASIIVALDGTIVPTNNTRGVTLYGDLIESTEYTLNPTRYDLYGIHNWIHSYLAELSNIGEGYGIMMGPQVSMRDPIFYEWHSYIDRMFKRHKTTLSPYSPTEGEFPLIWPGVKVTGLVVQTVGSNVEQNPVNELSTHFGNITTEIPFYGDVFPIDEPVTFCIARLEHTPFEYQITIEKDEFVTSNKATVRIFMAPRFNETGGRFSIDEQRHLFFALDAFIVDLQNGTNVFTRQSVDSALLNQWSYENSTSSPPSDATPLCGCGWPKHLLLPKGTSEGMLFDLFVMVTDASVDLPDDFDVNQEPDCNGSYVLCGIPDKNYPDIRPMGYPFDRRPFSISDDNGESRIVKDLEEYVQLIDNMETVQVKITHES